jgi:hypothetical protein
LRADGWIVDLETSATSDVPAGEIIELLSPVGVLTVRLTLRLRLSEPLECCSRGQNQQGTPGASNQLRDGLASKHSTEDPTPVRSGDNEIRIELLGTGKQRRAGFPI